MIAVGGQETSFDADARETLPRLPLADATLALWAFVWQPAVLDGVLLQCGGGSFEAPLRFAGFVELMGDALLQHAGRGRQSFARAQAPGTLPTAIAAGYGKLRRVPLGLSLGFFADSTARLGRLLPAGLPATELPPSRAGLTGVVGAGQTLQRVATRRLPARRVAGKGYGGKGRVAALPVQGLAVTTTARINPRVSTNTCRLRPLIFLLPSNPPAVPWVAVLMLWLSILPAEGSGCRPCRRRSRCRSCSNRRAHRPLRRHVRK